MFTLQTNKGLAQGDICDLLASVDGGALVALPAMRAEWRPGVVTGLAILHRVLSLYHDAPHPWPATTWRAVWDLQLGPELRRAVAPLNEPALFQPTVEDGKGKIRPYAVEALTVFPAKEHAIKSSASATPEEWLLGILGGQFRAFANFNVATGRSLALLAVPTDGTLGSETRSLSSAFSTKPGTSAKEHLPWLRPKPAAPVPVSDLPQPVLELERTIRLLEDGTAVYQSSNARWLAGDITDPSMVWDRTAGKRWAPRPDTPRYRMLHVVLAGSEDKERPPLVGRLDGNPALRVMCLHMGQEKATGASGGYWEARVRVPKEAGAALRLAGLGTPGPPGRSLQAHGGGGGHGDSLGAQAGPLPRPRREAAPAARHGPGDRGSGGRDRHGDGAALPRSLTATRGPCGGANGHRQALASACGKLVLPGRTPRRATAPGRRAAPARLPPRRQASTARRATFDAARRAGSPRRACSDRSAEPCCVRHQSPCCRGASP